MAGPLSGLRVIEMAGIGPGDLDCAEVHDASAPAELPATLRTSPSAWWRSSSAISARR